MSTLITAARFATSSPRAGHVGGHQHRAAAVGEAHQHLVAVALLQVAVQRQGAVALRLQQFRQLAAARLGVAEGQRARRPEVVQQARTVVSRSDSLTSYQRCSICSPPCCASTFT
jgi:hypothetical protein